MNRAFLSDMRRALIDSELSQHDGVARWTESVSYGGLLDCKIDGRHLANVLQARAHEKARAA